jgi:SNF2-related domain
MPNYQHWKALPYMLRAVEHLISNHIAGLPLRPGGRKTSIVLEAFRRLREQGRARTMLVIAPLRVCRQTWRQEAAKWEQFKDFKFSLLHGDKKEQRLKDDADIWLINPEGVKWLADRYFGRSLPFDIVTIDELTKFKNSQATRSKALRPRLKNVGTRWGLTGSLAPNGYMDLFGQMLMLDDGAALGRYITHYRDQYFILDYDGYNYNLLPGAAQRIVTRISPYWFKMDDADYAQLPPLVDDPREIILDPPERKLYEKMKRDMVAQLPEGIITAANSAACYSKLSQMANGAVYVGDSKDVASVIHDKKLEVIDELVEELNGEPLLIAYEFNHDLERLKEWYAAKFATKHDPAPKLPYLGKGTTVAQEDEWCRLWNQGKLPVLAAHPASAGHGLNMQGASACDVAWFSITWDYELYDQLIRRIRRDGTQAVQIFNHLLIVKGTIDELKLTALNDKHMTQTGLMKALNAEILRDGDSHVAGVSAQTGDSSMKLSRPGGAAQPQQETAAPAAEAPRAQPKGWGQKQPAADATQREHIQNNINPEQNRAQFSQSVQDQAEAIQNGHDPAPQPQADPAPAPGTRRRRSTAEAQPTPVPPANADQVGELLGVAGMAFNAYLRMEAIKVASTFRENFESTEDMTNLANEIMEFVQKP